MVRRGRAAKSKGSAGSSTARVSGLTRIWSVSPMTAGCSQISFIMKWRWLPLPMAARSEEHTSELQSLMRRSYAVFCLTKQNEADLYEIIASLQTHRCEDQNK